MDEGSISSFREKIIQRSDSVLTRKELSEYADFLAGGYRKNLIENQSVSEYLGRIAVVLDELEDVYKNRSQEMPGEPSWNMMALILAAAFVRS